MKPMLSGETAKETEMTTTTRTTQATGLRFLPLVFSALFGVAMITVVGHLQAATLHDAAHDVRHATGFPCH